MHDAYSASYGFTCMPSFYFNDDAITNALFADGWTLQNAFVSSMDNKHM